MNYYHKYLNDYKRGFLGFTTLGILGQSCLGSIAAMLVLMNGTSPSQMIQLFFIIILTMGFNGAVLAQQPPKLLFNILITSVVVSAILIAVNIIAL